jgi:hypothetical protein
VWWYSQDADTTVVWPNGLLPAFENPLFGDTFATRLDGKATLEATIEDVVWARKMGADEKWRWDFSIGLRGSRVDQESTMTDDAASLFVFDDQVVMHSEATGIGVVGGIGGRYDFTEWMWGSASFRMAFLTGTLDVSRSETAFGVPLFTKLDCARRVFRQSELDIRLNFRVQKHVALFVGYEFKQFDESTARILVTDDVADGNVAVDRSDLAFSGFSGGAVFAF